MKWCCFNTVCLLGRLDWPLLFENYTAVGILFFYFISKLCAEKILKYADSLTPFHINHYENMPIQIYWKFYHLEMKKNQINTLIFFTFLLKTDCGYSLEPPRRGGSNVYPQSMFLSRNQKTNVYPCKHQFYYKKKWGLKGSKLYRHVFVMS